MQPVTLPDAVGAKGDVAGKHQRPRDKLARQEIEELPYTLPDVLAAFRTWPMRLDLPDPPAGG